MATNEVPVGNALDGSTVVGTIGTLLRASGFWGAVLLPLAYGPLLYGGIDGTQGLVLAGLVVTNVVCLLLGREYADAS